MPRGPGFTGVPALPRASPGPGSTSPDHGCHLLPLECTTIDQLISRLASAGELLIDPPGDPAERDRQIARVVAAFPVASRAPDWLAFLRDYGGLTYVRESYSTGFFGVSYHASVHILDGEGDPVTAG